METTETLVVATQVELLQHLIKDREEIADFRDELNRDHLEKKIGIIKEKRVFYQNVLLASATLLGLASVFSSSADGGKIISSYLLAGLGFHLGVICVVVAYLREVLDQELEGLTNSQDRYSKILQERITIAEKYQQIVQGQKNIDVQKIVFEFSEELATHPTITQIKIENERHNKEREERMSGAAYMEFYGEIISFLFITGSAFVILAISGHHLSLKVISIGVLFSFWFTFTDFLSKSSKPIFRALTFLRRDIRSFTK